MLTIAIWSLIIPIAFGAYCGTSTIPYSFEVLPDGATVLGCARPSCFGWEAVNGFPASNDANFNEIGNGRNDGFIRNYPLSRRPFISQNPQTSVCVGSPACTVGQWVGGFNHAADGGLTMICCTYAPAALAADLGMASIHSGEIYSGGENAPGSFDFIQNIVPRSNADGSIFYDIFASRMSCPEPPLLPIVTPSQQAIPSAYNPSAYSTAYYGYSFYCFTADSTVMLADGSKKRMDELTMTEYVRTIHEHEIIDVPLNGWLHKLPEEETEFLVIKTVSGKQIKLTDKHFIYKNNCNSTKTEEITADELAVEDCLIEVDGSTQNPTKIESISRTVHKGIYAPFTDNGSILVDGIYASCYAEANNNILVQTFKGQIIKCDNDSLSCGISNVGASILLDMMKIAVPALGKMKM